MIYTASITFTAGTVEASALEGLRTNIQQHFKDWVLDHFTLEPEVVDVSIVVNSERIGLDLEVDIPVDDWEMGWTLWLDRLGSYIVGTMQVVVEKMFDDKSDSEGQVVIHTIGIDYVAWMLHGSDLCRIKHTPGNPDSLTIPPIDIPTNEDMVKLLVESAATNVHVHKLRPEKVGIVLDSNIRGGLLTDSI